MPSFQQREDSAYSPLISQLLYNRGLTEPFQTEAFLAADESLSGDPYLLPDMHQAVARLYQGLLSNEHIAIYGDFDADMLAIVSEAGFRAAVTVQAGLVSAGTNRLLFPRYEVTPADHGCFPRRLRGMFEGCC